MAVKDIQLLELGALIALLDKYYPSSNIEGRVLKGVRQAKEIWLRADIAEDGGDNLSIDDLKATVNVDITAITVGTIDVDIVAQTVGDLTVDINAQSVGDLTVDINAQSGGDITVDLNAQSGGDITVDINAQSGGDIDVNITNATITITGSVTISGTPSVTISGTPSVTISGTPDVDIAAQSVAIYTAPEWSAKEGDDKTVLASAVVNSHAWDTQVSYTPSGKTFYICHLGVNTEVDSGTVIVFLRKNGTTLLAATGGIGGNAIAFSQPIAIPSGTSVETRVYNSSASNDNIYSCIGGYEI